MDAWFAQSKPGCGPWFLRGEAGRSVPGVWAPERPTNTVERGSRNISPPEAFAVGARMDGPSQDYRSSHDGVTPEELSIEAGSDPDGGGRPPAPAPDRAAVRHLEMEVQGLRSELEATRAALVGVERLFHEAPAYVSVHEGPEHRIVFATALLERMLGGRRLRNVPFGEGFPPDLRGELQARFDAVYRSGYPSIQREVLWRVRDEGTGVVRELCADEVIQPWLSPNGDVRGVMRFAVDVMAQVKARRALIASEQRLRTVVERAPVGIALISEDLSWQRLNDELCHILQCEPVQILGRDFREIFFPEDWAGIEADVRMLQRGESDDVHREEQILRVDGRVAWCRLSLSRLDPLATGRQLVVIVDDVSERNEYRRKLEQEARRRDEFMAMLGHELRNPLAALANATELLRRHEGPPGVLRVAGVLERQTYQMRRMVDDLLDVARIAEGKIQLQHELLDIVDLVRSVADDLRGAVEARGLTFELDLPTGEVWVRGDRVRLTQVVQNLVDNAAKFTDAPGRVGLRVSPVDAADQKSVRVLVADSGCGMDQEMLRSAFEPFRQADRTLGRSRGGLGLGLPLVRGLVTMHHGCVEARSAGPGRGTEMHILLPRCERPADADVVPSPAGRRRRLLRVLVVEDHEDSAETLRELLETIDYRVCVAQDAARALSCVETFDPELVLCDIGLPGAVSGYDLARSIRARWGNGILLVALTGYGSRADQQRALAAGFDAHLTKPLDLDALERLTETRIELEGAPSSKRHLVE